MTARLTKHIEEQLMLYPCVSVPGLGSFLFEIQPAYLDHNACLIYPSAPELCFNELLQHQDGILAQSYAEAYAISHRRARLMVDEDVRSLRNNLIRRRRIRLGSLGTLSLNESGSVIFEPQNIQSFQGAAYGLSPVTLPQHLGYYSNTRTKDDEAYLHLRISKRSLSWASAIIIFILSLLPWGKSVDREPVYRASITPTEIKLEAEELSRTTASAELPTRSRTNWITPKADLYYIIIATEKSAERAEAHYTKALDWLPEAQHQSLGILQDKKLYRVSAAQFAEANEAYTYLKEVNKLGKEAWVYRAK